MPKTRGFSARVLLLLLAAGAASAQTAPPAVTPETLSEVAGAAASSWQADRNQLAELKAEQAQLLSDLAAAVARAADLETQLAAEREQVAQLAASLAAAQAEVARLQAQVEDLLRRLAECEPPPPEETLRLVGTVTIHPGAGAWLSFGHRFLPGEVAGTGSLTVGGQPATVTPMLTYPDGSLQHALITARAAPGVVKLEWSPNTLARPPTAAPGVALLINGAPVQAVERRPFSGPDLAVVDFTWSAQKLAGSVTVRAYPDGSTTWCTAVDNALATLDVLPGTISFSWELQVGGARVAGEALSLPYRERRTYCSDPDSLGYAAPDVDRWRKAGAIPNYAPLPSPVPEKRILDLLAKSAAQPHGLVLPQMGSPGGRLDIGLLPGWDALLLLTGDPRLLPVSLKAGQALGFFACHLRDPLTGNPYSIEQHPRATLANVTDSITPADKLPVVARESIYRIDSSHQPALGYMPYLLTGFEQYADGLVFLGHFDLYSMNWRQREGSLGLVGPAKSEMRSETWTLRTIAVTAATARDEAVATFFRGALERSLRWSIEVEAVDSPLGIIGRVTDTLNRYSPEAQAALKSIYRPWQEDQHVAMLAWLERLGVVDPALARNVGRWVAGNLMGRWQLLGPRDSTVYDLPGELRLVDSAGKVSGVRIRDWETLARYLRPPDSSVYNPSDPQHYQGIGRAAAAAAVGGGLPGAADVFEALDAATVEAFPARYAETPQWLVSPYAQ